MAVAGIQQVNSALRDITFDDLDTQLSAYLGTIEDIKSNIGNPAFIQRFVKPYGVYNNREHMMGKSDLPQSQTQTLGTSLVYR